MVKAKESAVLSGRRIDRVERLASLRANGAGAGATGSKNAIAAASLEAAFALADFVDALRAMAKPE